MAWIFVVRPPRERPIAWAAAPPLSPRRGALRLYGGTVDHRHVGGTRVRQRVGDAHPQPERSTCTIPLMTRRSSIRRAPGWFLGNKGSIAAHAASSSQDSDAIVPIQAAPVRVNQKPSTDS